MGTKGGSIRCPKDLGYDVEVRDDRKAKKVVEDYQI
jgi:hypothetical protein